MEKLTVLQIVGDPVGGIRKHVHDILFSLCDIFKMHYISSATGDVLYQKQKLEMRNIGIQHLELNIPKKPSFKDLSNILEICRFIRKYKIKLIHGHGTKGGLYARICGALTGCKVVYSPHGGTVHDMFGRLEGAIYRAVERFLCLFTHRFIFESNYSSDQFNRKIGCTHGSKIVSYYGIEAPSISKIKVTQKYSNEFIKLGVFAMLREVKGQHLVVKAIKKMVLDGDNIQVHMFGDGELKDYLLHYVHENNLKENVFLHGEVEDIYPYMESMDFILIPSLYEAFGYVGVEAALTKKVAIFSSAGGLPEAVGEDFGFMFKPNDVDDMIAAIKRAITTSKEDIETLATRAFCRAERLFKLERMCKVLEKEYNQLLLK